METFRYLREAEDFNPQEYYSPETVKTFFGLGLPKDKLEQAISSFRIPKEFIKIKDVIKNECLPNDTLTIKQSQMKEGGCTIECKPSNMFIDISKNGILETVSGDVVNSYNVDISDVDKVIASVNETIALSNEYKEIFKRRNEEEQRVKELEEEISRLKSDISALTKRIRVLSHLEQD